jgi:hypothetical protein
MDMTDTQEGGTYNNKKTEVALDLGEKNDVEC